MVTFLARKRLVILRQLQWREIKTVKTIRGASGAQLDSKNLAPSARRYLPSTLAKPPRAPGSSQVTFSRVMTLAEYEEGEVLCPPCGSDNVEQSWSVFYPITSKKSA